MKHVKFQMINGKSRFELKLQLTASVYSFERRARTLRLIALPSRSKVSNSRAWLIGGIYSLDPNAPEGPVAIPV